MKPTLAAALATVVTLAAITIRDARRPPPWPYQRPVRRLAP